jgi:glutamyl-tRNA synthetase
MIEAFDLPQIGRSPARFDFVKLENLNGHYMRSTPDAELLDALIATLPYLPGGDELAGKLDDEMKRKLLAAMPGLKERAKTLVELLDGARFLFAERPLPLEPKAVEILAQGRAHLVALVPMLAGLGEWTAAAAEAAVRAYCETSGAKLGAVAQPLRAALTGRATSPGIFDVLETLGRDESMARLADQTKV